MKTILRSIVIGLVLTSCQGNSTECDINQDFRENFLNCIHVAESTLEGSEYSGLTTVDDVVSANLCLEALTMKKSKMMFREEGFAIYETWEDFKSDKKFWMLWYEKNKCSFSMKKADSIFLTFQGPDKPSYMHSGIVSQFTWPRSIVTN